MERRYRETHCLLHAQVLACAKEEVDVLGCRKRALGRLELGDRARLDRVDELAQDDAILHDGKQAVRVGEIRRIGTLSASRTFS